MVASELREKSLDELKTQLLELLKEQFNLRMQNSAGQLADVSQLSKAKKNIARVKTIIREKSQS